MDVMLNWRGGMAFSGSSDSGHQLEMDADESVGGGNSAARPMEYIALGLAGCTGMDVISILAKKKQPVKNFQIKMRVERATEHPRVFTHAVIEYLVSGAGVDESALSRAIGLSAEKYCPAQAMLRTAFPITLVYKILDDHGSIVLREGVHPSSQMAVQ
ncbi:MAG: OsmC family protein [Anaerolineaceae bacterium]|nr:OsmC family protein [Anaerolineaceae bacterium]